MPQETGPQVFWKYPGRIDSYGTDVLRVDGCGDSLRHDNTAPTSTHDADQHVTRTNGVALQLYVLFLGYIAPLSPAELVANYVVEAEHRDALVYELGVQQLTPERTSPD